MVGVEEAIVWLVFLFLVLSPIWVFIDAPKHGLTRLWALGVFLFWLFAFPAYLIVRATRKRETQSVGAHTPQAILRQAPPTPGTRPPAWLPDPWFPGRFRYWDGERWTSNSSDRPKP